MSTGNECMMVQMEPDKWYYLLQVDRHLDEHDRNPFEDWCEEASCYGPFLTQDAAAQHLHDNFANPGGWWTQQLGQGQTRLDLSDNIVLQRKIEQAESPSARRQTYCRRPIAW